MNIIIFEDDNASDLYPFTINHAVFEIKISSKSNLDRIADIISPTDKLYVNVRDGIADLVKERYPNVIVNADIIPAGLLLNGASLWTEKLFSSLEPNQIYSSNGKLIALNIKKYFPRDDLPEILLDSLQITRNININHIAYLWDAVDSISDSIDLDVEDYLNYKNGIVHSSVVLLNPENIFISDTSKVMAGCIIDASSGPIIIDKNAMIDIGSLIKGPAYIGENVTINPGSKLIGNISLGKFSKVGGELSNVIIQGYSNKQHDGFLGNSFIGEWVNLGANSNNSNLKNNYSNVRVKLSLNKSVNTNKQFIGCFIGDYSRAGISTMLNTGTVINFGANIYGSGFQSNFIESFAWGKDDKVDLDKFLETVKIMKQRRGEEISESEKLFMIELYNQNN